MFVCVFLQRPISVCVCVCVLKCVCVCVFVCFIPPLRFFEQQGSIFNTLPPSLSPLSLSLFSLSLSLPYVSRPPVQ